MKIAVLDHEKMIKLQMLRDNIKNLASVGGNHPNLNDLSRTFAGTRGQIGFILDIKSLSC